MSTLINSPKETLQNRIIVRSEGDVVEHLRYRELYCVTLTYRDVLAEQEWEHRNRSSSSRFTESFPDRKRVTYYAAVLPEYSVEPVATACHLALCSVIGKPESWEEFEPTVESVEHLGEVVIELTLTEKEIK